MLIKRLELSTIATLINSFSGIAIIYFATQFGGAELMVSVGFLLVSQALSASLDLGISGKTGINGLENKHIFDGIIKGHILINILLNFYLLAILLVITFIYIINLSDSVNSYFLIGLFLTGLRSISGVYRSYYEGRGYFFKSQLYPSLIVFTRSTLPFIILFFYSGEKNINLIVICLSWCLIYIFELLVYKYWISKENLPQKSNTKVKISKKINTQNILISTVTLNIFNFISLNLDKIISLSGFSVQTGAIFITAMVIVAPINMCSNIISNSLVINFLRSSDFNIIKARLSYVAINLLCWTLYLFICINFNSINTHFLHESIEDKDYNFIFIILFFYTLNATYALISGIAVKTDKIVEFSKISILVGFICVIMTPLALSFGGTYSLFIISALGPIAWFILIYKIFPNKLKIYVKDWYLIKSFFATSVAFIMICLVEKN